MVSLHPAPLHVHSKSPALRPDQPDDVEPFISPEDTFYPTKAQEAYWAAFCLARNGEEGWADRHSTPEVGLAWSNGKFAGRRERERHLAFELGKYLGLTTGLCEPPAGYSPHEATAYREGFVAGQALVIAEDLKFEAWVLEQERQDYDRDRFEEVMARDFEITDHDVWPKGCMS